MVKLELPRKRLVADLEKTIRADLNHTCVGRSARQRLERAVKLADKAKLDMPAIRKTHARLRS